MSKTHQFFPNSMTTLPPSVLGNRVAILTRTKDRPVLLARAFASVLSQTHANWHLYLVNDGGDPAPVEQLLERHRKAFEDRLTVIHHPRSLGMEAASNAALAVAEADYIVVHDDDDSWRPEFLEHTTRFLNAPKNVAYAAVLTNCTVVHERIVDDVVIEDSREEWSFWQKRIDAAQILSRNSFPPIGLLIRKSVADAIGPFNEALPVLGDWDYALRILRVGDIATIQEPLAYYHHRRQTDQAVYGNSVLAGADRHAQYDTLYRNSLVRQLLQKEPAYLGLIHVLMRHAEEQHERVHSLLERECGWNHDRHLDLHNLLLEVRRTQEELRQMINRGMPVLMAAEKGMRPVRSVWRRLYPLRRLIAQLRGRV